MNVDLPRLLDALGLAWRRRGARLWAHCPHPEHHDPVPSWSAWDDPGARRHGRHRCYGCGFYGGPVDLVMAVLGVDAGEAARQIRDGGFASVFLETEVELVPVSAGRRPTVPEGVEFGPLDEWPTVPRRYLEGRGVSAWSVDRWEIGYAVGGDLGGRVVVPCLDELGELVGWSARSFIGHRRKYMTQHGAVSQPMGRHLWPARDAPPRPLAVVEGPFDGVAVDAASRGGLAVLVLQGSNPPAEVVAEAVADRWARVLLLSDPDRAGDRVADVFLGAARWQRIERVEILDDPAALHARGALCHELAMALRADA